MQLKKEFGITKDNKIITFRDAYEYKKDEIILKDSLEKLKSFQGRGTHIDENNLSLIAATNGYLRQSNNKINIEPLKIIEGNIGHLNNKNNFCPHSLWVKGDVLTGAELNVGGNLQIDGTVENVNIACHGNIVINGNILGQGNGKIVSKGDIYVNSCSGAKLISLSKIVINDFARHCNIISKNSISVLGRGEIFDGNFYAKDFISARIVGSPNILKTIVSVGYNFMLRANLDKSKNHLKKFKLNFNKNKETLKNHFKNYALENKNDYINLIMKNIDNIDKEELYYLKALENIKLMENIRLYSEKIKKFPVQKLTNINAYVESEIFYPGTTVNILDKKLQIIKTISENIKIDRSNIEKWQQY